MDFPFYTTDYIEAHDTAKKMTHRAGGEGTNWIVWVCESGNRELYVVSPASRGQPWGCEKSLEYKLAEDSRGYFVEQVF